MLNQNPALPTTVVGSFPLDFNEENMQKVFMDQIEAGIDFPCYPQLIDMVYQFLNPLSKYSEEIIKKGTKFILKNDFEIPKKSIAKKYGLFVKDYLKKNPSISNNFKGIKACLTGPITLSTELILGKELSDGMKPRLFREPRAVMKDWIVEKFAKVMNKVGKDYQNMGFDIIAMDEPILSLLVGRRSLFHDENFYLKIINQAFSGIKGNTSIHVCGTISPNLRDLLLRSDIKILDHEFQTNNENFNIYNQDHLKKNKKLLAMGTVKTNLKSQSSDNPSDYVESIPEIEKFIKKGIKHYGKENLIIKPDCGFRALQGTFGAELAYEIAKLKLKNMVNARNNILKN